MLTDSELREKLAAHVKWLRHERGGKIADFTGADLSGADLGGAVVRNACFHGASFCGAYLFGADFRGANLRAADFSGADMRNADFRNAFLCSAVLHKVDARDAVFYRADCSGADFSGAELHDADLRQANLSGARGLASQIDYLDANFERTAEGYIAYKVFGMYRKVPSAWRVAPGAVITETVCYDRTSPCGSGVNVATLRWVKARCDDKHRPIWKCLIRYEWLAGVCVPYASDGKIRTERVELVEVVRDG